jgi:anthranilate phosphoribosyltransferase
MYSPESLNFERISQKELDGGNTPEDAAKIFDNILSNTSTKAQKNTVIINSAFAIRTIDSSLSLDACIDQAKESIESGVALNTLKKFIALNN